MRAAALISHHTSEELEVAYRQAERPIERSRWQIIWLKSKGKSIPEIIDATGFSRTTISTLIAAYNANGEQALLDKRQFNKSDPALNPDQQEALFQALQGPPLSGGLWTSKKVKMHIQEHFGIEVTEVCAWGYLKRLGFPIQVPRPTPTEAASPKEQEAFIKKSRRR
ncbi:helix-turn-helix domain-containing protein [Deinococcus hopiensis]|uniref:helix-turn-helix domain-containing protein n=1 Tax=Deinococcus hopiensis TaxID=309885 RepID=UPI000A00843F|nr:winged helix-turn-helix domain-containing protein [Deinococcus hopiensis]